MLEQEEHNLRQQLLERDMRLQESERRQEVSFFKKNNKKIIFRKDGVWGKPEPKEAYLAKI